MAVVPPASVVRLVKGVVFPTSALKVVIPAVFTLKSKPPLTVSPKLMLLFPVLLRVVFAAKVAAFS